MENMNVYCNNCKREVNHEVLEINEGVDCWLIIKVKCSECGREHEICLYS